MLVTATQDIRNIAFVGQAGAGKSALLECLLKKADARHHNGGAKRTHAADAEPLEKIVQHSLASVVAGLEFQGTHLNVIDTPGYPDFIGRAMAVLPAVETVAAVIHAQMGAGLVTDKMMAWGKERGLDRLIIVNHIDHEEANLAQCMEQIRERYGAECLPLNLPANKGHEVVDCYFAPQNDKQTDFSSVEATHSALIDQVVEVDEKMMELYLEQGEALTPEQLHDPFEQALREGHLIPVCFVSAKTGAGLDELLTILTKLMPNPTEGNPPAFVRGEGAAAQPVTVSADPAGHVLAHVFKLAIDPFVGKLSAFRVHQGTLAKDSQLFIGDARKPFKVAHLLKFHGRGMVEVDSACPGDICAVSKVDEIHFDAVLHDSHEDDYIHLAPTRFPEPMYGLAIAAKSHGDEQKLSDVLQKISAEDPSLRVEHNSALNETVVRGLGDLHLRAVLAVMKERFNVDVDTRPPKIAYRETITAPAESHYRHKKQTGGAGQFGEVFLRVRPLERGAGFKFSDDVFGGAIPKQFIPAVEKGVLQALHAGVIAGYAMEDIEVSVYDGKYHPVDSKEVAFVTAGKKAFIEAVRNAKPVVLEPMVLIRVVAPSQSMGDITADLSGRRCKITASDSLPGAMVEVTGMAPLSELDQYQSKLKSITGGAGSYSLEFSHYEPVPVRVQQALISEFKPTETED